MTKIKFHYFLLFTLAFANPLWASLYLESSNGLKFTSSENKNFWCKLGVLVKLDAYSSYDRLNNSPELRAQTNRIRKAEVSVSGSFNDHWGYSFKLDWLTFFAKYSGLGKDTWLYLGQVIIPFGLENACGSKWSPFLERSLPTYTFSPGYGIGGSYRKVLCDMTFSASLTTVAMDRSRGRGRTGHNENQSLQKTLRITYVPIHEPNEVWHFGISARYQRLRIHDNVRLRSGPEINLGNNPNFLRTELQGLNYCSSLGLEFASLLGPFCVQAELIKAFGPSHIISNIQQCTGGYIQVSYILTGESRDYDFKSGTFGRIRPNSCLGAWDIAFRSSYLNLESLNTEFGNITNSNTNFNANADKRGGRGFSTTFALGWTLNKHVRIFGNYMIARTNQSNEGKRMMEIFGLRLQWLY